MEQHHGNGNGNGQLHKGQPFKAVFEIRLPELPLFRVDTPERAEAVLRLIRTVAVPGQMLVAVTPEFAQRLIDMQSPHQRNQYQRNIQQLANDYLADEFLFTGDSIRFQVGGIGIDGQHRLLAQILANVTHTHLLTVGLSAKAALKIDGGRRRSVGDRLRLRGDARVVPTAIESAAINLEAANFDKMQSGNMSDTAKVAATDQLTDLELEVLNQFSLAMQEGTIRSAGALAGALRAYKMYNDQTVVDFLIATFANQPANPSYIPSLSGELFNYLNRTKTAKGSTQPATYNQVVAVIKTVEALVLGGAPRLRAATTGEIERLTPTVA